MRAMDAPLNPSSESSSLSGGGGTDEAVWVRLRDELAQLNVQLEYLKLLLKLGVHRF